MPEEEEPVRHAYAGAYDSSHPVPTVQQYRREKEERKEQEHVVSTKDDSRLPVPSSQKQTSSPVPEATGSDAKQGSQDAASKSNTVHEDTTQATPGSLDPKQKRKEQKNQSAGHMAREVTDPITHLPVTIHDFTDDDIKRVSAQKSSDGHADGTKSPIESPKVPQDYNDDILWEQQIHKSMESLFPPPDLNMARNELARIYAVALSLGLSFNLVIALVLIFLSGNTADKLFSKPNSLARNISWSAIWASGLALSAGSIWALQDWAKRKVKQVWDQGTWEAERRIASRKEHGKNDDMPTSPVALNVLLGSIWPMMNPDLFNSLADMLEDVMQASLPKLVRMVSVEDIGQGSEPLRVLAVRPLPKGAATKAVSSGGELRMHKEESSTENDDEEESKDSMDAEEGEFINLEIAFSYSSKPPSPDHHKKKRKSKNAHIYLAFYLPGNIKLPVWVELNGMVGLVRVRLQLTPDPPFIAKSTMTFLGQPKVNLSCIPLVKQGLNIMDMPLISNFVQSAIDAATAEYVAPKSISLDLKAMLAGEDFKKDTTAIGILAVTIKRAFGYKSGDTAIPLLKNASSDPYVSLAWAKFGKPLWTTRVLIAEMEAYFFETAYILIGPQEIDADESLRLQLWDSDRTTADDDLGRIEVGLEHLMHSEETRGKMCDRTDDFKALKSGESMPGSLSWSVGYYGKTKLADWQVERAKSDSAKGDDDIKTVDQLKEKITTRSRKKLRESAKDETGEMEQIAEEDFNAAQVDMIASAPPSQDYPSGILSVQIHQITGLSISSLNQDRADEGGERETTEDDHEKLPSSYCTIILNQQKVYKTRTKPKNAEPFFNAVCERFIGDWREAELLVSVRNQSLHELDALLGVVHVPLAKIFKERSQSAQVYPIAGGVGYGRIRISLVFRPIDIKLPSQRLGWNVGTLEVYPGMTSVQGLDESLKSSTLKLTTSIGKGHMYSQEAGTWAPRHSDQPLALPVTRRYSNNVFIEFRRHSTNLLKIGGDKTDAFSVLWLQDLSDNKEVEITLPVFDGDSKRAKQTHLPEDQLGKRLGEIKLKVKFWPGLSAAHKKYAGKDADAGDVMEALECAADNDEDEAEFLQLNEQGENGSGDSSSDSSDSDDDGKGKGLEKKGKDIIKKIRHGGSEDKQEGKDKNNPGKGIGGAIQGYEHRKDALHRQNRGAMQWKGPRTLRWMKAKAEHMAARVGGNHDREPGIETEA